MQIKIGDYLTFRSATRSGNAKATRKVNGFYLETPFPTVRYHGWSHFVVYEAEIIAVNGEPYVEENAA